MKPRIANPRWLWIVSLLVGGICAGAFGYAMLSPAEESKAPHAPAETTRGASGLGFGAGLIVGIGGGIAIGLAIGRARERAT